MNLDISWLIGFIEAKGCFTIPLHKISKTKKSFTKQYISSLDKESIVNEIARNAKLDFINSEKLKELSIEELRTLLTQIITKTPKFYYYFPRPSFFLNFSENDLQIVNQILTYFKKFNINFYGPYETNKGKNLRLELKGVKNCLKLYDLLSKEKWYTSKKENFEKWGNLIFLNHIFKFKRYK